MNFATSFRHQSGKIQRDKSTSDFELAFLPPTAATRSKISPDDDTITLLDNLDTAYAPVHKTYPSKRSHDGFQAYLNDLRAGRFGRYVRLTSSTSDSYNSGPVFRGWRKAVILAAAVAGIVLIINGGFAIVASVRYGPEDGVGTLYDGDCGLVKRWDTALHSVINLLGTALLAASSFTMQCLSSPTRGEVDAAHNKRKSLDIGLPSFKNLFHVKAWKGVLWLALCLSTLPLHLLWNSTIFSTSTTFLFSYVVADETFLSGAAYQEPVFNYTNFPDYCYDLSTTNNQTIANIYNGYLAQNYTKLDAVDCFNLYNLEYLNVRRNLIIITAPTTSTLMDGCNYGARPWNGSSVLAHGADMEAGWIPIFYSNPEDPSTSTASVIDDELVATARRRVNEVKQQVDSSGSWTLGQYPVQYCYSETAVTTYCKLQYVSYIIYVVTVCNAIKCICMCLAARYLWNLNEPIFATIGDATSSFLQVPDETTKGMCLLDVESLRKGVWTNHPTTYGEKYDPIYKRQPRRRLYSATTRSRWWWTMILCTLYLIIGFVLFSLSFQMSAYSVSAAMKLKFGQVDSGMILNIDGASGIGLIQDVLVANSFQLALSTTYFLYNSLYTAQYAALEWSSFARGKRRSLRVTWPRGLQRSTYYLQLPWRYGIPLTALLILMHFLISQSIFLARLIYIDSEGAESSMSFTDVGFSPPAILTSCCVGLGLILAQVVHACRPLENLIPIHGNKSTVISAMCHPENRTSTKLRKQSSVIQEATELATQPLMWGVTEVPPQDRNNEASTSDGSIQSAGHCTFSADVVELPQIGRTYR